MNRCWPPGDVIVAVIVVPSGLSDMDSESLYQVLVARSQADARLTPGGRQAPLSTLGTSAGRAQGLSAGPHRPAETVMKLHDVIAPAPPPLMACSASDAARRAE